MYKKSPMIELPIIGFTQQAVLAAMAMAVASSTVAVLARFTIALIAYQIYILIMVMQR